MNINTQTLHRECEELVEAIEYLEGLELESTRNAMIEANERLEKEKDNLMQEMSVLEARLRAERDVNHRCLYVCLYAFMPIYYIYMHTYICIDTHTHTCMLLAERDVNHM
jgi:hypothetical protein